MTFKLPELTYTYDALEPHIDGRTMEIHHSKHHAGYTANLNAALKGSGLDLSIEEILADLNQVPDEKRNAVRNNGGGYYNHKLFWTFLSPDGGGQPEGQLAEAIDKTFGSFDAFKESFDQAAKTRFGSGWAWLVIKEGILSVESTPNQDSPISEGKQVLLGLDVWEHAYYLNYQNRRPDYVAAFWNVVNWEEVSRRYNQFS